MVITPGVSISVCESGDSHIKTIAHSEGFSSNANNREGNDSSHDRAPDPVSDASGF